MKDIFLIFIFAEEPGAFATHAVYKIESVAQCWPFMEGWSFKARCPRRNTFQGKSITANYIDCGKKICNTWAWAAQN